MHHCLSGLFTKGLVERSTVVLRQVVPDEGLSTILVYPLQDLEAVSLIFQAWLSSSLTLYPAAYPRPGNREMNFFPTGAAALSLKMTVFNWAVEAIC